MSFELKILGSNSATPAYGRHHTAQLLRVKSHNFLIDCGEGTQIQLSRYKCKALRINHIFISHLHGDHYLGLMGLIFTMHLLQRKDDLFIYGQKGLQEIITTQLKYSDTSLNYKIHFHELQNDCSELLFEDKLLTVHSFPLNHRIACCGFLFKEKPKPIRLNKEKLPENISLAQIGDLKKGLDIIDDEGNVLYKNSDITLPPRKSRTYAYCSDTKYDESILPYISDADLLYHEATFLEEKAIWAEKTFHSTTTQAATIAKMAGVKHLLIGHYSARYKDLSPFLNEAKSVFENTSLATEGESTHVPE
ncbi:ribonuclease Z [Fulvivirga sediminis]|uniref:Ribonuclease Z n=1 Tax=Fulvivirga sediminis TaxID=2803949 RepID=A0A937FCC5_9BACT|nr:ribonuclease Z [Fulvivirga sediminis]MBL3658589.1 ribonuclease Z [Fulvivirga sediminis]